MYVRRVNGVRDRSCITEARFRWYERGSHGERFEEIKSKGCIVVIQVPGIKLIRYHAGLIRYFNDMSGYGAWFIVHEIQSIGCHDQLRNAWLMDGMGTIRRNRQPGRKERTR